MGGLPGSPHPGDMGPPGPDEAAGVDHEKSLRFAPLAETREAWAPQVAAPMCACGCGANFVAAIVGNIR